jgi:capsular polysaccharide export protein
MKSWMASGQAEMDSNRPKPDYSGRRFLFLQGLATPFFGALAAHLRSRGAFVERVNFRTGDRLWWKGPARNFRGKLGDLPDFYESLFRDQHFSDVLLFGDMRPVHSPIHPLAEKFGARVHVFEEAYIRPDWITVEREGVNLNSPLPRDPDWYREAADALPPETPSQPVRVPIALRAAQDLAYRVCGALDPVFFPHYRTHRPRRAAFEYTGWCFRYSLLRFAGKREKFELDAFLAKGGTVFVLPLQLNGDSQIVHHSDFDSVGAVVEKVVRSFAANAPDSARLVVKNHPLDTGLDRHGQTVSRVAKACRISDRVFFSETANLAEIFPKTSGVVVVNSTTGLSAIWRGLPVHALAEPVYKMPGLVDCGELDRFWSNPKPPDSKLFTAFRKVLLHVNHVNGDYFSKRGIALAVQGCDRMLAEKSPLEELLERVPLRSG